MSEMNDSERAAFVAQYVVFVEQTAHVTDQRAEANRTFIAVNAALLAGYGFVWEVDRIAETALLPILLATIALTGIFVTSRWRARVSDYRQLLKKRFTIIMDMESSLPTKPYQEEYALFQEQPNRRALGFSFSELQPTFAFSSLHTLVLCAVLWLTFAKVNDMPPGVAICGWFKDDAIAMQDDVCWPMERNIEVPLAE